MLSATRAFLGDLGRSLLQNRLKDQSAQLAFWSLLSVFPFFIFLLTIIAYIPLHGLDQQALDFMDDVMPEQAAALFEQTLHEVVGRQRGWLLLVSLGGALWSAAGGMGSTSIALNLAFRAQETRPWWKRRVLFLGLTLGAAGATVVATSALFLGPVIVNDLFSFFGFSGKFPQVWRLVRWPLIVADLLFMLACLYHFLPNVKRPFRLLSIGSMVAVALWVVASLSFNLYVTHFHNYARTYGALGTAVVLILWLYLSSLVVILGGEIDALLHRRLRISEQALRAAQPVDKGVPLGVTGDGGEERA